MTQYLVSVIRRLNEKAGGDSATIDLYEGDEPISNKLTHIPPVENNVSYYHGTFASHDDALAAIRRNFPHIRYLDKS